jgi:hypothetical protein
MRRTDVLKKTSAATGLVICTAAGALFASSPAYALDSLVSGSWSSNHHRSHHRNHNWNGNHHHGRIFIRIYIYNKNNNHAVAIARPERGERERRRAMIRVPAITTTPLVRGTASDTAAPAVDNPAPAAPQDTAASQQNAAPSTDTPANSAPGTTGLDEAATGGVSP